MKVLFSLLHKQRIFKRMVDLPFHPFPGLGWQKKLLYEVDFVKVISEKGKNSVVCTVKFHSEYRGLTDKQIEERIAEDGFKQYA